MKGAEESIGGYCRKFFQAVHNRHLAVVDIYTANEYAETIQKKSGVEVGKVWHRCEVFEG